MGKIKGGAEGAQLLPVVEMLKTIPEESASMPWVSLVPYLRTSEITSHACPALGRKHVWTRWTSVTFPNTIADSH